MAGNKFNRYLWLINILQRGPIPYKEISKAWEKSAYNDKPGVGLPLKTFHNHCEVIAEMFGVDVECEKRGRYGYYIKEPAESEVWKFELLNQLLIHLEIKENPSLTERVLYIDGFSDNRKVVFLDYIQKQAVISFVKPGAVKPLPPGVKQTLGWRNRERIKNGKHFSDFLVLSIVSISSSWYVIGAFVKPIHAFI